MMTRIVGLALVAALFAAPATASHHEKDDATPTIVGIASSNADFSTLASALEKAGLVATLEGDGPFTVFAPTNAAFSALPAGTLESLLKPENREQLVSVLTYHVVPGKVTSGELAGKKIKVETVEGGTVDIDAKSGVTVDGALVVKTDIMARNGVIHVIDRVILPN